MRFFLNTSAAKPITAGGMTFEFELVGLRGGSWLGILAVADDAAASILAATDNSEEIPEANYEELKKKSPTAPTTSNSPRAQPQPPSPSFAVAEPVGRPTASPIVSPSTTLTPITLLTTKQEPPVEQLLAPGHKMARPK